MIAPKDESKTLVMEWLKSEGLINYASMSPRLDAVIVDASVKQIEGLLNADYEAYGEKFTEIRVSLTWNSFIRERRYSCPNTGVQSSRYPQGSRGNGPANDILRVESNEIHDFWSPAI